MRRFWGVRNKLPPTGSAAAPCSRRSAWRAGNVPVARRQGGKLQTGLSAIKHGSATDKTRRTSRASPAGYRSSNAVGPRSRICIQDVKDPTSCCMLKCSFKCLAMWFPKALPRFHSSSSAAVYKSPAFSPWSENIISSLYRTLIYNP